MLALLFQIALTVLLLGATALQIPGATPVRALTHADVSDPAAFIDSNEANGPHQRHDVRAHWTGDRQVLAGAQYELIRADQDDQLDDPAATFAGHGSKWDMQAVSGLHAKRDLPFPHVGETGSIDGTKYVLLPLGTCGGPGRGEITFEDGPGFDLCPGAKSKRSDSDLPPPKEGDRQIYGGIEFELRPLHTCPAQPTAEISFGEDGSHWDLCPVDASQEVAGYQDPRVASHAWGKDGQIYRTNLNPNFFDRINPVNSVAIGFDDGTTADGGGISLKSPCHKMEESKKLMVAAWKPGWVDNKLIFYQDDRCKNKLWSTTKMGLWWFNATDVNIRIQSWKLD